jgi:methylated-DNA-[protein]-cysteine S-methyltransferase
VTRATAVLPTRFGPLQVVVDDAVTGDRPWEVSGAVVASSFRPTDDAIGSTPHGHPLLEQVAAAVAAWDSGEDPAAIGRVPVALPEVGFRHRAWAALREVPPGATVSYAGLAALAGNAAAARAAGTACARNPVAPFVPCHRVVAAGGNLGGYGYGAAMKRAMLTHEGAAL